MSSVFGICSGFRKSKDGATGQSNNFDLYVRNLMGSISIDPIRNTDIVETSITASSPFEAAFVTNTLAETYKLENQLENQAEVKKVKDFLEEQLQVVQNQLQESEIALKDYMEKEKVVALDNETQELVTKIAEFEITHNTTEEGYDGENTKNQFNCDFHNCPIHGDSDRYRNH